MPGINGINGITASAEAENRCSLQAKRAEGAASTGGIKKGLVEPTGRNRGCRSFRKSRHDRGGHLCGM